MELIVGDLGPRGLRIRENTPYGPIRLILWPAGLGCSDLLLGHGWNIERAETRLVETLGRRGKGVGSNHGRQDSTMRGIAARGEIDEVGSPHRPASMEYGGGTARKSVCKANVRGGALIEWQCGQHRVELFVRNIGASAKFERAHVSVGPTCHFVAPYRYDHPRHRSCCWRSSSG